MRYLSFDIECCDGKHICEFGYVITNEQFEVLEKQVITINPDKPFNLTGRKDQDDLTLFFSNDEYYNSPLFPVYYDKIKALIEAPNQIVIGHAIGNDAMFLRTACIRYKRLGLKPINFDFVDSQKIYREFANKKESISLEKAEAIFNLEKPQFLHKSDDDALLTIQLVSKICSVLEMSLPEIISLCPTACGKSHYFNIMYTGDSLSEMLVALDKNVNALSNKKKQKCIAQFAEQVQPNSEITKSKLTGTKLCLSTVYEKEHTKKTIKLIQLLANHGCQYHTKVSENDFYVASTEDIENSESEEHTRYYVATHRDDGQVVEVLTIEELLTILSVTEDELAKMAMPKVPKKEKQRNHRPHYSEGKITTSLGDILRAQNKRRKV